MKIELRYTLTREELISYIKYVTQRSPTAGVATWVIPLGFGTFLAVVGLSQMTSTIAGIVGAVLALVTCGLGFYYTAARYSAPRRIVRRMSKDPNTSTLLQELRVTIDGEGLRGESSREQTLYKWHAFEQIVRHGDATFFMLDRKTGIVLPDRVFEDDAARDEALRAIERFRAESRPFQIECPTCGYDLEHATSTGCPECGWRPNQRIVQ